APERRAAAPSHELVEGGPPPARRDRAGRGRARRPDAPLPAPALGRTGAAHGHRTRDRGRPDVSPVRRADRRPRPQERRRHPGPPRSPRPRSRQDGADGDARPARRGARAPGPPSGEGRARGVRDGGRLAVKYLHLVVSNLFRKKTRTALTAGSFAVALFLFGILSAVDGAFQQGVDVAGVDRLVVLNRVSIIQPLPLAYRDRIARIPGVSKVTFANWFGGVYQ